jgi:hypothetical protein
VVNGDPTVISALALGWEMSGLYAARKSELGEMKLPENLPSESDLRHRQRVDAGIAKVAVLIERVLAAPAQPSDPPPSTDALCNAPMGKRSDWEKAVYDLHIELVVALRANDMALFHAYDLGRSLADTCRRPEDLTSLVKRLETYRLLAIEGRLADLSSKLPSHSGAAVSATLEQWGNWSVHAPPDADMAEVRGALTRQGTLWRALLTGEKDAQQMLDPDAFVAAAIRLARRLGTIVRGLLRVYLPAVALVVVAAILVLYVILNAAGTQSVVASLGALAASLGITRKGLSVTVEGTIDEIRPRLWGAELDTAVAQSILRLPFNQLSEDPIPAGAAGRRTARAHRMRRMVLGSAVPRESPLRVSASGPATTGSSAA